MVPPNASGASTVRTHRTSAHVVHARMSSIRPSREPTPLPTGGSDTRYGVAVRVPRGKDRCVDEECVPRILSAHRG